MTSQAKKVVYSYKTANTPVGVLKLVATNEGLAAMLWENDDPKRVRFASKGACVAPTRGLAMEPAPKNIRVNAVSLGIIRTALHEPESLEGKKSFARLNRYGEVADVTAHQYQG